MPTHLYYSSVVILQCCVYLPPVPVQFPQVVRESNKVHSSGVLRQVSAHSHCWLGRQGVHQDIRDSRREHTNAASPQQHCQM